MSAARTIGDESSRVAALSALIPYLPATQMREMLRATRVTSEYYRPSILNALIPHLPTALLQEAQDITRTLRDVHHRTIALSLLVLYLPEDKRTPVLEEVWNTARAADKYYPPMLIMLAPHLPTVLLEEALNVVHTIGDWQDRASVLSILTVHLPESKRVQVMKKELISIEAIQPKSNRASALTALAPYLPVDLMEEALSVAYSIGDEYSRAYTLAALVPHLLESQRGQVIKEIWSVFHVLTDEVQLGYVLGKLTPYILEDKRMQVLLQAIRTTRRIKSESKRAYVLSVLAPYLSSDLMEKALSTARTIGDNRSRTSALYTLIPYLSEDKRVQVIDEVLDIIRAISGDDRCPTDALEALAPYLPANLVEKALGVACTIEAEYHRANALSKLAPRLAVLALQQPQQSYFIFVNILPILAARPRPHFINDLAALMPFILALAADEAPQAAEGIYHAIQEVCGWWP